MLGLYSDLRSHLCSDSTQNSTLAVLSIHLSEILICLTAIPYSRIPTPLRAPCLSMLRVLRTLLRTPARIRITSVAGIQTVHDNFETDPHLCSSSQSIHFLYLQVRSLAIQLRLDVCSGVHSDICASFHLTSSSPHIWTPFGPPSLSALQVLCGSKPLTTTPGPACQRVHCNSDFIPRQL
jgi:hypothetical protein